MVVRVRHLWNKTTREVQFYLTSLGCDACKLGQAIRLHWSVENGLHWTLDAQQLLHLQPLVAGSFLHGLDWFGSYSQFPSNSSLFLSFT